MGEMGVDLKYDSGAVSHAFHRGVLKVIHPCFFWDFCSS